MAIDYGGKRTGIAVTDPMQIIATALTTIPTQELISFLEKYIQSETVEKIIIGLPLGLDGEATDATAMTKSAIKQLQKKFPALPIIAVDERFTSKMASRAMVEMGMKKKERRVRENVDKIAATIMLQTYLEDFSPL